MQTTSFFFRKWKLYTLHKIQEMPFFYVLLTVHLSIILVINQFNAQNLVL